MGNHINGKKNAVSIVFLDVDGVLNSHGNVSIEVKKLELLKQIIDKTNAKIVISSTWRNKTHYLHKLKKALSKHDMQFIDCTPNFHALRSPEQNRINEIKLWLNRREHDSIYLITNWIAIDDLNLLKYDKKLMSNHFVNTKPNLGLTQENVNYAIQLLN